MSAGRSKRPREDDGRGVDEGAREVERERERMKGNEEERYTRLARVSQDLSE